MTDARSNRLRAWLEILRPPNLPTVPGDPMVGFLLAQIKGPSIHWTRLIPVIGAALCLYMAGLIWNDIADVAEDARTRPDRPIPSGRIRRSHAVSVALFLSICGPLLALLSHPAAGVASILLLALILSYTFLTRRHPLAGLVNMGACRAVSMLMGAAVAWPIENMMPVIVAAAGLLLLITSISAVALRETEATRIGPKRFLPAAALVLTVGSIYMLTGFTNLSLVCAAMGLVWLVYQGIRLAGAAGPAVVGPTIGAMIKALLLFQAGLCAVAAGPGDKACAILLLMWPLSTLLTKWFYGS